jgi:hypothetical protein
VAILAAYSAVDPLILVVDVGASLSSSPLSRIRFSIGLDAVGIYQTGRSFSIDQEMREFFRPTGKKVGKRP